jgi:hypothetical protein
MEGVAYCRMTGWREGGKGREDNRDKEEDRKVKMMRRQKTGPNRLHLRIKGLIHWV